MKGKIRRLLFLSDIKQKQGKKKEQLGHNFSYPQAGFWWLVDRKLAF